VVPVDLGSRTEVADLRSSPEFAHYRHEIWDLLHDEVARAQRLEKEVASV
jgi:NitT/TauT family transport system ATP-binding protein